jgi:hypothetical protein
MTEPTEADRQAGLHLVGNCGDLRLLAAGIAHTIAAARVEERERCAKIAESAFDRDPIDPSDAEADATWIAAKIRSGE